MNESTSSQQYAVALGGSERWSDAGNSLRKSVQTLIRNRWVILGCVVLALMLGLAVTLLTKPTYAARATFEVQADKKIVGNIDDAEGAAGANDRASLQTQLTLLQSRGLAHSIVDSLNLASDADFGGDDASDAPDPAVQRAALARQTNRAIAKVNANLEAATLNDSMVVEITYRDENPHMAARIANAAMDEFFKSNVERGYAASSYARNFLSGRLAELRKKLEDSERELIVYAGDNGILAAQSQTSGAMGSQSLESSALAALIQRVAQARTDRITAEQSWRLGASGHGSDLPALQDDNEATALKSQLASLESDYQQKRATFLPDYPPMQELKSRIDRTRAQLARINQQNVQGLRASFELAQREEQALQAQLESLRGSVFDTQNRGIRFATLQREVDTNRALYDALLQRYKEIGAATGSENDLAPVDKATVPTSPESPKLWLNLLIAFIIGLVAGIAAAFIRDALEDRISTPEDVESKLHLPLLGTTPEVSGDVVELLNDRASPLGEAYFSIQTALRLSSAGALPKTVLVASCETGEGKTTTALGLAGSHAARGLKVLLIDADLRRPSLHRQLDVRPSFGLSDVTTGAVEPLDAVVHLDDRNFDFLAAGAIAPNPAQLLSVGFAGPLAVLSEHYDSIIIDSAPVLGLADAPLIADLVDGCIFVMEAGRSRPSTIRAALKRLANAKGLFYGIVLTKFNRRLAGYGYDYETYRYTYGKSDEISS
ncbi:GumC family protein [Novosphingobium album (ex Liu et al. 2023)]|uniref:Polysaccharide biosynthesis tyrosine autokinase n=1 Tax=Novosphingobium album (ex Liu et al. 2023) TaxID=3031130 RepID=A0ABT5WTI2_9SPHN|nr:polysaccharide biosynthesis tyrosine autokinase [Novosphingobium album (ex Liu et al. 2023)]MDE8653192.1 polysaccharide biosynthesis tyrosine autokinase [Novosphingobium album (ex Liu et al. 2023)]